MITLVIILLVLAALAVGVFYVYPAGKQRQPKLSDEEREYYEHSWRHVQGRFVDDPVSALETAETLITQLLQASSYAADGSDKLQARYGDHAVRYQAALETSRRVGANPASTSTEDMRKALVDFRALSDDLLGTSDAPESRFNILRRKVSS